MWTYIRIIPSVVFSQLSALWICKDVISLYKKLWDMIFHRNWTLKQVVCKCKFTNSTSVYRNNLQMKPYAFLIPLIIA